MLRRFLIGWDFCGREIYKEIFTVIGFAAESQAVPTVLAEADISLAIWIQDVGFCPTQNRAQDDSIGKNPTS